MTKKVKELNSIFKQKKLTDFIKVKRPYKLLPISSEQNIEDLGKPKAKFRALTETEKKAIEDRKEKERQAEEEKKRLEEEERNPIAIEDDFQGWLKCQKRFWRKYRKQRKIDPMALMKNTGVFSMMKNFDQYFLNSTLQILQIQSTTIPGILKLWVRLENNLMYSINLKVNRKFYINSKVPQDGGVRVTRTLPRERSIKFRQYHLYQIEQNEKTFVETLGDLVHYHISNTNIDGVFETHVPLDFRVILE